MDNNGRTFQRATADDVRWQRDLKAGWAAGKIGEMSKHDLLCMTEDFQTGYFLAGLHGTLKEMSDLNAH